MSGNFWSTPWTISETWIIPLTNAASLRGNIRSGPYCPEHAHTRALKTLSAAGCKAAGATLLGQGFRISMSVDLVGEGSRRRVESP
jgi:hypothetical protein